MSRLARVTFNGNSLTGTYGFASLAGANSANIAVTGTNPGVGLYAADWTSDSDAYGQVDFDDSQSEVFCYIYLILDTAPASSLTVLQMLDTSDAVIGEINIENDRTLTLKNNNSAIGSASSALTLGGLYRIGLHYKAGGGSDAELDGYLATNHQDFGVAFASSNSESNTTSIDHLRVGAVDAVALDGRIGLVAARSEVMPGSWLSVHDVVFHNLGLMYGAGGSWAEGDITPGTDRAASGESRYDTWSYQSFRSQSNWGGGAGQMRDMAQDSFLTGIGHGWNGYYFPPRAKQDISTGGGTDSFYIHRDTSMYGYVGGSNVWTILGTATTDAENDAPVHQPVTDTFNNVYYAADDETIHRYNGVDAPTDVTPTALIDRAKHVSRFGRHIWGLGERDIPNAGSAGGDTNTGGGNLSTSETVTITQSTTPSEDDTKITFCWFCAYDDGGTPDPDISLSAQASIDDWYRVGEVVETSTAGFLAAHTGGGLKAQEVSFDVTTNGGSGSYYTAIMFMMEGIDTTENLNFSSATDTGGTTLAVSGTSNDNQIAGIAIGSSTENFSPQGGWTEHEEVDSGSSMSSSLIYRTTSDADHTWTGLDAADDKVGFHLGLADHPSAGATQFTVVATSDQGTTWTAAPATFSAAIMGEIRASQAADEYLWLSTDRGLWRMIAIINETGAGEEIINIGFTGPHDVWSTPPTDNAGKFMGIFEGLLYYTVGGSVRRFAMGNMTPNQNRVLWPSEDWAANAGTVQALVCNEAGVWWGADGFLWMYDGRSVQQMAAEPSANAFDALYWHQGRLYLNTNPADYFDFGYANIRPDVQGITASNFDTGYMITSSWDFQKAADPKIIKILESQVSFTGGDSDSGSITWHYRNGCGTDADPGVGGGGDTGSAWTEIGTHSYGDGGYKIFDIDPPIACYRVFFRATITPGTSGIPVLHLVTVYGGTLMPQVSQFNGSLVMQTGQVDNEGNSVLDTVSQVRELVLDLKAKRKITGTNPIVDDTLYYTLYQKDGTDGGEVVDVIFERFGYAVETLDEQQNVMSVRLEPVLYEIPR